MRNLICRLCLLLVCFALPVLRATPVETEQVKIELLSQYPSLVPGEIAQLGLRIEHAPGWHTYWINPGDSGLSTKLKWTLPAGFLAHDVRWPVPKRFHFDDLYNFGYDGDALLPVPVGVPATAKVGDTAHLSVEAKWLVCHEECVPGRAMLELDLPIVAKRTEPNTRNTFRFLYLNTRLPFETTTPAHARLAGDRIEVSIPAGNAPAALSDAFAAQPGIVANSPPKIETRGDLTVLTFAKSDYFSSTPEHFDLLVLGREYRQLVRANFVPALQPSSPSH